jgi:hypothetical protein
MQILHQKGFIDVIRVCEENQSMGTNKRRLNRRCARNTTPIDPPTNHFALESAANGVTNNRTHDYRRREVGKSLQTSFTELHTLPSTGPPPSVASEFLAVQGHVNTEHLKLCFQSIRAKSPSGLSSLSTVACGDDLEVLFLCAFTCVAGKPNAR